MVLRLHRFSFLHLHGALQLVQRHHLFGPDPCSDFSSDLRAHCFAIIISTLLESVHNFGLCGFQFFAQIEIEDVVLDVDWNELLSSVPIQ